MKDEIKEILEYLNEFINDKEEITKYGCEISVKRAKNLLDYITTLQEENEKIRKMNRAKHKYAMNMEDKYITEKAKNQKAIEKINSMFNVFPGFRNGKTIISENLIEVLNILKGSDNK